MLNKEMESKSEQLFVFDGYFNFVGVAASSGESPRRAEDIIPHIIQQALAEIAIALNNEAKHGSNSQS